jgi:nitronate monooxygenase
MLRTRLTELLGLTYPIVSAPMAMHSGGTLAAAVSMAGGLGTFGGIHPRGPEWVREQVRLLRAATDRVFGVGYITSFIPFMEDNFNVALEERVPVIALSFGDPQPWLGRAKDTGVLVMCQVQTFAQARKAVEAGADIVVAQGSEGGGHSGPMNMLPLLTRVLDAFPDTITLAAGGVTSGRALAAVLAAGADGAWVGTALLATPENVEVPEEHKQIVVASDGEDTIYTRVFDVIEGYPWPAEVGARAYHNRTSREWHERQDDLAKRRDELLPAYREAQVRQDPDVVGVYYGQGAAAVTAVRPAGEVVQRMGEDAERILRERLSALLS